jgi:hypothetical protein
MTDIRIKAAKQPIYIIGGGLNFDFERETKAAMPDV